MAQSKQQTARRPAIKLSHLRKKMEKNRLAKPRRKKK
jgi:hypothetical protein